MANWPLSGVLTCPCLHPRLIQAFGLRSKLDSSMQANLQAAGLFISLAMALVGGIIVGEWRWLVQRRWGHSRGQPRALRNPISAP